MPSIRSFLPVWVSSKCSGLSHNTWRRKKYICRAVHLSFLVCLGFIQVFWFVPQYIWKKKVHMPCLLSIRPFFSAWVSSRCSGLSHSTCRRKKCLLSVLPSFLVFVGFLQVFWFVPQYTEEKKTTVVPSVHPSTRPSVHLSFLVCVGFLRGFPPGVQVCPTVHTEEKSPSVVPSVHPTVLSCLRGFPPGALVCPSLSLWSVCSLI